MTIRGYLAAATAIAVSAAIWPVRAEERLEPLAQSGDWIALAHRVSMTAAPDMCIALNMKSTVGFRSDGSSVDVRVIDKKWSLPTGVDGEIAIVVADLKVAFKISDNDATSLTAEVPDETYPALFAAMDKASAMTVTVGKAKPLVLSLSGSAKVLNAFRTCAGIKGTNQQGGENPFK